ncbi:hypothetical protein J3R30DRAFT_3655049 [Lentinula aciculospora]|uniref:F-box domain-containing protein n=1 Tax=Lentinula aciculospora TaxID=153920 RepID=A0A9W9DTF3_9AGAR|nr:hypothetical protein J3R30DRAFT_3655049 [Lentinula aciculospora]
MSTTYGTGDEPFLQFDPYEESNYPMNLSSSDMDLLVLGDDMTMLVRGGEIVGGTSEDSMDKGKRASRPLPIMISAPQVPNFDDLVMSPAWSTSSYSDTPTESPSPGTLGSSSFPSFTLGSFSAAWPSSSCTSNPDAYQGPSVDQSDADLQNRKGKGKERDDGTPSIPSLSLSPITKSLESLELSSPGPSSSANRGLVENESASASTELPISQSVPPSPVVNRLPSSRRHTISHNIIRSRHTSSLIRLKAKFTSPSRTHTRKVLSKKLITPPAQLAIPQLTPASNVHIYSPASSSLEVEIPLEHEALATCPMHTVLTVKGRSYIPAHTEEGFVPIASSSSNIFDEVLPKELRLQILLSLVAIHESDKRKMLDHADWSVMKAISSKNRWVGKDRAVRELVKLSRVSKSWRDLILDGQLWSTLDFHSFPTMPRALLSSIARSAARFINSIDFSGHVYISPAILQDVTDNLCLTSIGSMSASLSFTQLTAVNFRGCSALSTRSLHYLLVRSPELRHVCFRGLQCVTNTTCDIIAMYCPRITKLDLNRCPNMDADGLNRLISAVKARGELLHLIELRISGIRNIDDSTMRSLGQVAPFLEVLDLSYARHLHNSALDAFVALNDDDDYVDESVFLTAREAGRDPGDFRRYRRRVTRLRHLSLSSCILLTDIACSHLAHAVPRLEFLELAGIGEDLGDEGLIRLLNTTPLIRRLDLEDATEITDAVLFAITPRPLDPTSSSKPAELEPGHALEHLVISYAIGITDDALLLLIQSCTRLKVLEADNTRMGSSVLQKFCELQRPGSKIVAVDCRSIPENVVKELAPLIRPRRGWRGWDARKLRFLDGRDFGVNKGERNKEKEAIMKVALGQDELDEKRVVVKTFYSWQTVDAVWSARDKRRKAIARRKATESSETDAEDIDSAGGNVRVGGTRWWSPGGRRSRSASGSNSPLTIPDPADDTCVVM